MHSTLSLKNLTRAMAAAAVAGCLIGSAMAQSAPSMTRAQHSAAEDTIKADYKAAKNQCDSLAGNKKDVCEKEAEGQRDIALAELETRYKPSADNDRKLRAAKAKAAYEVADEKCEDFNGSAKDSCELKAKSDYEAAKAAP